MDRKKFRQFLHDKFNLTDDVIMDRIFKYFNRISTDDIDKEEWVIGFNVFLKGSDEELMKFCFDIYDLNEDGFISREEMMLLLKDCMIKPTDAQDEEGDEGVKVNDFIKGEQWSMVKREQVLNSEYLYFCQVQSWVYILDKNPYIANFCPLILPALI